MSQTEATKETNDDSSTNACVTSDDIMFEDGRKAKGRRYLIDYISGFGSFKWEAGNFYSPKKRASE